MGRRLKLLLVSRDLLADLFRQDSSQRRLKMTGMPADARIVGVSEHLIFDCDQVALKVESEEFPELDDCQTMERFEVAVHECHPTKWPTDDYTAEVQVVREHDGSCWRAITEEEYLALTGWKKENLSTPTLHPRHVNCACVIDEDVTTLLATGKVTANEVRAASVRFAVTPSELRVLRGRKLYKLSEESKGGEMVVPDYGPEQGPSGTITLSPQEFEAYEKSPLHCKCSTDTLLTTGCTCGGS